MIILEQLTKPESLQGYSEKVVNVRLTSQNITDLHEALTFYIRHIESPQESSAVRIAALREEIHKLHRLFNPS